MILNNLRVMEEVQKIAQKSSSNIILGITIIPSINMGEIIQDQKTILTAKVNKEKGSNIDELSLDDRFCLK